MKQKKELRQVYDIEEELKNKEYGLLREWSISNQGSLIEKYQKNDYLNLTRLMQYSRLLLDRWYDSLNEYNCVMMRCGAWLGTLETIEQLYQQSRTEQRNQKKYKEYTLIKHLPEIISLLELKGVMTHKELCESLGMKNPSNLSEVMKKIEKYQLIDVRKKGKYKIYSLTDNGVSFGKTLNNYHTELKYKDVPHWENDIESDLISVDFKQDAIVRQLKKEHSDNIIAKIDEGEPKRYTIDRILDLNENEESTPVIILKSDTKFKKSLNNIMEA